MKEIARFKIGSKYFFEHLDGYKSKDNDVLILMDDWKIKNSNVVNFKTNGDDVFLYKNMDKDGFIQHTLESNVPMKCGKFLIKEFNDFIGFNVEDLKIFKGLFQKMDEKHTYEKYIYQYFIQNGNFELTSKQLLKCFDIYNQNKLS